MAKKRGAWDGLELSNRRYRVEALLGAGGMGFVYRARDRNLDADVVIKVPRPEMIQDPDFAFRFRKEIQALVKLGHPHIVKVSDAGEHQGLPFGVMQYLTGGSLEDRIMMGADGQLVPHSPESLLTWLPDVAGALDFVHARGFVHRDVKPGNILFDESGFAFLSDFGIVKAITSATGGERPATMTSSGGLVGTLEYMSYELVVDQPYDGRADQYALAVTAYEVLAGRRPFSEQGTALILRLGNGAGAPALHDLAAVPPGLSRVIHRAMSPDQAARFPTCAAFASAVAAEVAAGRSPSPSPTPTRTPGGTVMLRCPACRAQVAASEAMRGKSGRCMNCQARFRIADDLASLEPIDATTAPAKRRRAIGYFAWAGAGVVAMVASLAALAITLAPGSPPAANPPRPLAGVEKVRVPPVKPPAPRPEIKPADPPAPIELAEIPRLTATQGGFVYAEMRLKSGKRTPPDLKFHLLGAPLPGVRLGPINGDFVWATPKDQAPADYWFEIEARSVGPEHRSSRVGFVVQVQKSPTAEPTPPAEPSVGDLVERPTPPQAEMPGPRGPATSKAARTKGNRNAATPKKAQAPANPNPNPAPMSPLDERIARVGNVEARRSLTFAKMNMRSPASYGAVKNNLSMAAKVAPDDPEVAECAAEIQKVADDVRSKAP